MLDASPKRRLDSPPKIPDSAAVNPETPLNSPEKASNDDIGATGTLSKGAAVGGLSPKNSPDAVSPPCLLAVTTEEPSPFPPVPTVAPNGVEWFPVPGWEEIQWLWHGFSARRGGVTRAYCAEQAPGELNLGFTGEDDHANVVRNRQLLAEAVTGDSATPLVTVRQIHSSVLVSRDLIAGSPGPAEVGPPQHPHRGDGLMTSQSGLLLGIQTADCIPVLVADHRRKSVAAFHAGWRGTVRRIVENGIGRMRLEFGSQPEDLVAAIGPGVGQCCYAVGEEVLSEFESQFTYGSELFREVGSSDPVRTRYPMMFLSQRAPGHSSLGSGHHLDLIEANRRQLLAAGLQPRAIRFVGACTNCHPELFFSHRGSRGRCGRMMSVIGIR
jgi:YfiH family protein